MLAGAPTAVRSFPAGASLGGGRVQRHHGVATGRIVERGVEERGHGCTHNVEHQSVSGYSTALTRPPRGAPGRRSRGRASGTTGSRRRRAPAPAGPARRGRGAVGASRLPSRGHTGVLHPRDGSPVMRGELAVRRSLLEAGFSGCQWTDPMSAISGPPLSSSEQ